MRVLAGVACHAIGLGVTHYGEDIAHHWGVRACVNGDSGITYGMIRLINQPTGRCAIGVGVVDVVVDDALVVL